LIRSDAEALASAPVTRKQCRCEVSLQATANLCIHGLAYRLLVFWSLELPKSTAQVVLMHLIPKGITYRRWSGEGSISDWQGKVVAFTCWLGW
jgi:hypothetical protein